MSTFKKLIIATVSSFILISTPVMAGDINNTENIFGPENLSVARVIWK